ncbi:hypothetical protein FAGAP_10521 [Fusarium agapanthi]|uniref:Uncharacterized protein n=1 Tax=Fusarium agapanthi TaxID=1803897 RepID=A0A9P5B121_9HYPO|nr:hypothetical protein FAGAP_10521 [Fusarium agapanthi]
MWLISSTEFRLTYWKGSGAPVSLHSTRLCLFGFATLKVFLYVGLELLFDKFAYLFHRLKAEVAKRFGPQAFIDMSMALNDAYESDGNIGDGEGGDDNDTTNESYIKSLDADKILKLSYVAATKAMGPLPEQEPPRVESEAPLVFDILSDLIPIKGRLIRAIEKKRNAILDGGPGRGAGISHEGY